MTRPAARAPEPGELKRYGMYIGGETALAADGPALPSVNPTRGRPWAEIADGSPDDVDRCVAVAEAAFRSEAWAGLSATARGRLLLRLADEIDRRADELAVFEVLDNGKLYAEMRAQLRAVPDWLRYYGGLADKIEGRVVPLARTSVFGYTLREPLGVVGIVTPWNSPTFLTMMGLAPALAAGNTVVIKPSEVASTAILELMACVEAAGFPPGVINVVTGGPQVGAALAANPGIARLVFTGGTETGRRVAATVAERLGAVTLELGGKSPNVVFEDASLDAALAGVLAGIYAAGGQTCVAGSRLLVQRSVHDELVARLIARAEAIRLGDPMDASTQMGPIATEEHLGRIERAVDAAAQAGATILCGGARAQVDGLEGGFFYRPTIVAGVSNDDAVAREEIFGPVLAVLAFDDEEEALALANDTRYGLAAGVWTSDVKRAHRMARRLEAGTVWINTYRALTFNMPFGGMKDSGHGRENGLEAIDDFLQTKGVWCELGDEIQDPFVLRVQ